MIYQIKDDELVPTGFLSKFGEVKIEELIVGKDTGIHPLDEHIFGEGLLYLGRQKSLTTSTRNTADRNRLDVVGLDCHGRGVIIELKKDQGKIGMETQALFYLSMMANLRGLAFLRAALQREPTQEELDYICRECNCEIEDLNRESRIILLARVFHSGIFALGNWIGKNSCAVKAVRYHVTEISNEQFIEFSTEFVVDPHQSFSLHTISSPRKHNQRAPSYFWHNIGNATADWWDYVVKSKIITASYDNANSESSRGRVILEQYQPGDTIIAFASGYGAVGVGEIPATSHYEYKEHDLKAYEDSHYHRRGINWLGVLPLASAVKSNEIRSIGLNWPTQTKQEFLQDPKLAIQLRDLILAKVSKSQKKTA